MAKPDADNIGRLCFNAIYIKFGTIISANSKGHSWEMSIFLLFSADGRLV